MWVNLRPGVRGPGPAKTASIAGPGSPPLRVISMATPLVDKALTPIFPDPKFHRRGSERSTTRPPSPLQPG